LGHPSLFGLWALEEKHFEMSFRGEFRVGDPVHAVKHGNRLNNLFPGVVVKVHTSSVQMMSKPLGMFNVCCSFLCRCITCGLCVNDTIFYDIHFTTGEIENRIPSSKVFAAPIEQPR
jgi:hypothetical protein